MTLMEAWKLFQEAMPVLALLGSMAVLLLGTRFVLHKRCKQHRQSIRTDIEENAAARQEMEKAIRELATKKDLEGVKNTLSTLTTQVNVLQESMNGQRALFQRLEVQVDRIDTFRKGVPHI